jgi:hypothetical protein
MDVNFSSAALAELCNSEHRLARRWGRHTGRVVARRLLDLAAADAAVVCRGTGETTITFGQEIVIRGVIGDPGGAGRILITSLHVNGGEQP